MAFQNPLFFFMAFFIVSISSSHAYTFQVGGKDGWTLHPSEPYNNWAGRLRFLINDTLHFKYDGSSDSVLVVNKGDYDGCNTYNPITKLDGGDSSFKFDRSGPFYFITGNKSNCDQGQKLIVVVLAVRNRSPPTVPTSPSPTTLPPSPVVSPVLPPSKEISPSLPPSETPVLTPPMSTPGEGSAPAPGSDVGEFPGGSNPSADTTSPPSRSVAATLPLTGAVIASVVTVIFVSWAVY